MYMVLESPLYLVVNVIARSVCVTSSISTLAVSITIENCPNSNAIKLDTQKGVGIDEIS